MVALIHSLLTKEDKMAAFQNAFYRAHLPNINQLIATVLIFLVVIYFQGFRVDLPFKHQRIKGHSSPYSVKLFYTSNMPIILQTSLISNLFFISQLLYKSFGQHYLVQLLGQWQDLPNGQQSIPVSGLVYYMSPIRDVQSILDDPYHALFYCVFVVLLCGVFSKTWINISGTSPKDVARQLKN